MLDDFEGDYKIEGPVGKREGFASALQETDAGLRERLAGVRDCFGRNIHGDDTGGVGEFGGAVSGAATGVEYVGGGAGKSRRKPVARHVLVQQIGIDEVRDDALAGEFQP